MLGSTQGSVWRGWGHNFIRLGAPKGYNPALDICLELLVNIGQLWNKVELSIPSLVICIPGIYGSESCLTCHNCSKHVYSSTTLYYFMSHQSIYHGLYINELTKCTFIKNKHLNPKSIGYDWFFFCPLNDIKLIQQL